MAAHVAHAEAYTFSFSPPCLLLSKVPIEVAGSLGRLARVPHYLPLPPGSAWQCLAPCVTVSASALRCPSLPWGSLALYAPRGALLETEPSLSRPPLIGIGRHRRSDQCRRVAASRPLSAKLHLAKEDVTCTSEPRGYGDSTRPEIELSTLRTMPHPPPPVQPRHVMLENPRNSRRQARSYLEPAPGSVVGAWKAGRGDAAMVAMATRWPGPVRPDLVGSGRRKSL